MDRRSAMLLASSPCEEGKQEQCFYASSSEYRIGKRDMDDIQFRKGCVGGGGAEIGKCADEDTREQRSPYPEQDAQQRTTQFHVPG